MWNWLKKLFGIKVTTEQLYFIKKVFKTVVYLVLRNNPAFVAPVSAALFGIEVLIKRKEPAVVVQAAIDKALGDLAAKFSNDPFLVSEIKDLKNLIVIEIEPLPEDEKLAKIAEIIDAFKVALEAAQKV